jgi:hypothetical protein
MDNVAANTNDPTHEGLCLAVLYPLKQANRPHDHSAGEASTVGYLAMVYWRKHLKSLRILPLDEILKA